MSLNARQSGFTLIELAIVMTVSALLLVGAARAANVVQQSRQESVTKETQTDIVEALQAFLDKNGRLPCPAPLTALPDSDTFGYEVTDRCNQNAGFAGTFRDDGPRGRVRIGAVPTRSLNIADEKAFDGWGRRMTYAVSAALADATISYDGGNGGIGLVDGGGNPIVTPPDSGVMVVVSHGKSANGAWLRIGSARPCNAGRQDGENCNRCYRFRSALRADDNFDNIVRFSFPDDRLFHIARCGKAGRLYSPDDPAADTEGCILPPGLTAVLNCGESVQIYDGSGCASP